jgi:hypothetical protein
MIFCALQLSAQDPSAIVDFESPNQGILVPRTDTSIVNAAHTPAKGLLIFQNSDSLFYYFNGAYWVSLLGENPDADPANELQQLSLLNDTLMLDRGGIVVLPEDIDSTNFFCETEGSMYDKLIKRKGATGIGTRSVPGYAKLSVVNDDHLASLAGGTISLYAGLDVTIKPWFSRFANVHHKQIQGLHLDVNDFEEFGGSDTIRYQNGLIMGFGIDGGTGINGNLQHATGFAVKLDLDGDLGSSISENILLHHYKKGSTTNLFSDFGIVIETEGTNYSGGNTIIDRDDPTHRRHADAALHIIDGSNDPLKIEGVQESNNVDSLLGITGDGLVKWIKRDSVQGLNDSDDQQLSISNDTIFLENGGFVVLPGSMAIAGDTKLHSSQSINANLLRSTSSGESFISEEADEHTYISMDPNMQAFGKGTIKNGNDTIQMRKSLFHQFAPGTELSFKVFITPNSDIGSWWVEKKSTSFVLHCPDARDGSQYDFHILLFKNTR